MGLDTHSRTGVPVDMIESADQTVWAMTLVVQWSKAPPGEHHKYYFERTLGNGLGMWTRDMDRAQPFEIHAVENLCRAQRRDSALRAELEAHGYELVSVVPNRILIPPADVMALPHTETQ